MLLGVVLATVLFNRVQCETSVVGQKPCTFPLPLDFPNRNDRSDQCWLRVEDLELTETVSVWCYVAHSFLRSYISDYNTQKMTEDNVDVGIWDENSSGQDDVKAASNQKAIKDWKSTTVLDPITHMRWYVTKNADCRLIMYSREGMSNYKIDCEKILFHINNHQSGNSVKARVSIGLLSACIALIFYSIKFLSNS